MANPIGITDEQYQRERSEIIERYSHAIGAHEIAGDYDEADSFRAWRDRELEQLEKRRRGN